MTYRRTRRRGRLTAAVGAVALLATVALPLTAPTADAASRGGTIVTLAAGDAPVPDNFNPFSTSSPIVGTGIIYEPLFIQNQLDPTKITPWLAKSWSLNTAGTVLTFNLNSGITWSDGKPFGPADVAFTMNLVVKNPALNVLSLPVTGATVTGPEQVQIDFSANISTDLPEFETIPIVPQHLWAAQADPATFTNPDPVGTGPFMLDRSSFSSQGFLAVRNPHYWQKHLQPKIAGIRIEAYESNTSADLALENGQADWAGNFVPDIKQAYVARSSSNHYWFPSTGVTYLCPNDSLPKYAKVDVRKGISAAINRSEVVAAGETGEVPAATTPTGLILPLQKADLAPAYAHATLSYNPKQAVALFAAAGYHRKHGTMVGPDGTPFTMTLEVPSSWTDTLADFQIVAQDLKAIGVGATVDSTSYQQWVSDFVTGKADTTLCLSSLAGASTTPWATLQVINGNLTRPVGQIAVTDTERYTNPQADALFSEWSTTTNAAVKTRDMDGLEKIMATQMPVIPLSNTVAWGEYSTARVTGWPSATNPYATVQPSGDNMLEVALHLVPVHSHGSGS